MEIFIFFLHLIMVFMNDFLIPKMLLSVILTFFVSDGGIENGCFKKKRLKKTYFLFFLAS